MSFFKFLKKAATSTAGLITIASLVTVSLTLSVILMLPKSQKTLYSYYISDSEPEEITETVAPTDKLVLDAVASNNAISVAIAKGSERIKGINFSVIIKKGKTASSEGGTAYSDSNGDGIIHVNNLSEGVYTVFPKSVEHPYYLTEAVTVSVVAYKPITNILNKTESGVGVKDDTVALKNDTAQKNHADEKDNSAVTIQYTLPERDENGNIIYITDKIKKNYMPEEDGKIYEQVNKSGYITVKENRKLKKLVCFILKRETIDKNLPATKAATEVLVPVKISDSETRYDLYYVSALTHKSEKVVKKGWNIIGGKTYYYTSKSTYLKGWQYIGGHRYFFNSSGVLTSKKGIDVSVHQKNIDWKKVAADGIDYAIIRAAYRGYETGKLVVDPKFERNIKGALSNGIEVGVYIFSSAVNAKEAVEEASLLLKLCEKYKITYPYVIDIESANSSLTGRADRITNAQRTEVINAFCATIRAGGKKPMLYTGMWYYSAKINKRDLVDCPLWIAYYADKDKKTVSPKPRNFNIWQYSSSGSVDGIEGRVDMNALVSKEW